MAAEPRPRRPRPRLREVAGGVRFRTTLAATVVVGVALLVGTLALLGSMRTTLLANVRVTAEQRAESVATSIEAGTRPAVAVGNDEQQIVQVVDGAGRVVAVAGPHAAGRAPLADLEPGGSATVPEPDGEDPLLVVAADVEARPGAGLPEPLTVLVAHPLDDALESVAVVGGLLAAGVPVLLVVVAATTWALVGRALGPVEAIRTEVERISASELHRRVPDPPGDDEVARLATTMNRMLGRLEQAQARQRRFVADASHELRSPVATLRQHAEVAAGYPGRSSLADLSGTVLAESERMAHLIDDLLLLARSDEQPTALRRRPVDLDDVVLAEARRLRALTGPGGEPGEARPSGEPHHVDTRGVGAGRVLGDHAGLARVLRNLGDNAARHARTTVALAVHEEGGTVVLTVDDDGPGIPADQRGRVFDRFVRLDASRARGSGGVGLGLAIVAELVAAHGGVVDVAQAPLGGARFEVRLPAAPDGS